MSCTICTPQFDCAYRAAPTQADTIYESHCHLAFEMILVLSGSITVALENRQYTLGGGSAAVISPLCYHSVYAGVACRYERVTVLFAEEAIPSAIRADFFAQLAASPVADHPALLPLFDSLRAAITRADPAKAAPLVDSLLVQLIYALTDAPTAPIEPPHDPSLDAITAYIDQHITEKITLDALAGQVFLSKSTICHRFQAQMKISIKQYILQKKLTYAARLMQDGTAATEAAKAIGYENYANFYRMYRKFFGTSPGQRDVSQTK